MWGTQWKSAARVIDDIADQYGGEAVTLRIRSSDSGDSIFDTAVLVDAIEINEP